jgi:hypothetical protein
MSLTNEFPEHTGLALQCQDGTSRQNTVPRPSQFGICRRLRLANLHNGHEISFVHLTSMQSVAEPMKDQLRRSMKLGYAFHINTKEIHQKHLGDVSS